FLLFAPAEQRVDLQLHELLIGVVLDGDARGRHQLVLAADDAGVEPPGVDDVDLKRLGEIDRGAAAAGGSGERKNQGATGMHAHAVILIRITARAKARALQYTRTSRRAWASSFVI